MGRILLVLLALTLSFSGCKIFSSKKNTPEYVAYQFLDHLQKLEFSKAKPYGTESTKQMMDLMDSFLAMAADNPEKPTPKNTVIVMKKCDINGDKAVCSYTTDGNPGSIDLLKEDGKWLVDIKKEAPQLNSN